MKPTPLKTLRINLGFPRSWNERQIELGRPYAVIPRSPLKKRIPRSVKWFIMDVRELIALYIAPWLEG